MRGDAWLLDASIYIFRAWFSLPDQWHTRGGKPLNAVYGYAGFLLDLLSQAGDINWMVAAFDESLGTGFRHALHPGYKSSRELPDPDLAFQLEACRKLTELSGITCYSGPAFEADDYLASVARQAKAARLSVTVLTRDKDLGQLLLDESDAWWDPASGQRLDSDGFTQRFGVLPSQFADYLALVGDKVDDIPGVPGIGPKTASALLTAFGDIEGIWANLPDVAALPIRGAARLEARLVAHREQLALTRQLTSLEWNIPALVPPPAFETASRAGVADYLETLGIDGPLLRRWQRAQEAGQCA